MSTQLYFYYHGRTGLTTWDAPTPPEPPNQPEVIEDKDRLHVQLPTRREEPPYGMHRRELRKNRQNTRKKRLAPPTNAPLRGYRLQQEEAKDEDDYYPRKVNQCSQHDVGVRHRRKTLFAWFGGR